MMLCRWTKEYQAQFSTSHRRGMERAAGTDPGLEAVTHVLRVYMLVREPARVYIRSSQSRGWEEV